MGHAAECPKIAALTPDRGIQMPWFLLQDLLRLDFGAALDDRTGNRADPEMYLFRKGYVLI
jgi:hypothetical protein